MNEKRPDLVPGSDDTLAALVRSAGPRAMPDADQTAPARASVHAEWQASLTIRRRGRWQWLAAASLAVLAAGVGFFVLSERGPGVDAAVATRVTGDVEVQRSASAPDQRIRLRAGSSVRAGEAFHTGDDGRALLTWVRGASIRVDHDSELVLESDSTLRLLRGAVYVDTELSTAGAVATLTVLTPAGAVRHVGTRFEVRVAGDDHTRVRVRDGTALFTSTDRSPVLIGTGQQLAISGGRATLEAGPGSADPAWEWTAEISPTFAIEGRSLYEALEWLSREGGLEIVYANTDVRTRAQVVILHGSIEGLGVREALQVVLAGSGFEFEFDSDRLRIRAAPAS